jgi:diketogulonate reductase-like aldo/keto reductase
MITTVSGNPVHPIGIGTWDMGSRRNPVTSDVEADYSRDDVYVQAIQRALALGQNHLDTAELYGHGHTEELVGQALRTTKREAVYLASKVWVTHYRSELMQPAVASMLERLDTDYLDLLYVHTPKTDVPMAEYMTGLNWVVASGKARAIGVSNMTLNQLQEAVELADYPITALQVRYNVLYKAALPAELLAFCRERHISIVAYRPIERGAVQEHEVVRDIASTHQATSSQVALAWLLQQPGVYPIPKATSQVHLQENWDAANVVLSEEDMARLTAIPSLE